MTAGPRSLSRLLGLFSQLARAPQGLTLAELNAALDAPKSSMLNLLRPLVADGYLLHDRGAYRLGPAMFRLSSAVRAAWSFPGSIRPIMEELSARTGETVLLAVMDRAAEVATYVEIIDSPHPVRYQIPPGTTRPLYASTAGRLLLALSDRAWQREYLASLVVRVRTATPVSRTSLARQMAAIRREGVSWSIDGYLVGLSSVSAPVLDGDGHCVAALGIAGPTSRFSGELGKLGAIVKAAAARASGASPP